MKYRPSKKFLLILAPLAVLVICIGFGILHELEKSKTRPIPGEITFRSAKFEARPAPLVPVLKAEASGSVWDWFTEKYPNLFSWTHDASQRTPSGFGDHYFKLGASKDPGDQAKFRELNRLSEAWYQKLLLRYPELAVTLKSIPDAQNGFLKWLDLADKIKATNSESISKITFPKEIDDFFAQKAAWNPTAAKDWITQNQSLVDQIHAIGLLPEHSVNGIPLDRLGPIPGRFAKNCGDILMLEARLAADQGNQAAALESIRSARGLADHFSEIETPDLLAATVKILIQLDLESRVLSEILPALPPGQVDLAAWENALRPTVSTPAEFAKLMKGEWHAGTRQFILPMLMDAGEPLAPPDSGELLDHLAQGSLDIVRTYETANLRDLSTLGLPPTADTSPLSRNSRQIVETLGMGREAWLQGWKRAQSASAMTQAAFAIMKGQAIPQDPIYGLDYQWDPATRVLSMPAGKSFDGLQIKPIKVPKF